MDIYQGAQHPFMHPSVNTPYKCDSRGYSHESRCISNKCRGQGPLISFFLTLSLQLCYLRIHQLPWKSSPLLTLTIADQFQVFSRVLPINQAFPSTTGAVNFYNLQTSLQLNRYKYKDQPLANEEKITWKPSIPSWSHLNTFSWLLPIFLTHKQVFPKSGSLAEWYIHEVIIIPFFGPYLANKNFCINMY